MFPQEKTCQCRHGAAEEANHHDLYPVFCNGRVHYAFLEVCAKLFPGLPIQTVKSRMRNLGLKLLKCPSDKQDSIRKARPNLACYKTLSLLSEQDVSTLEAYHDTRTRQKLFAGDELNENNNCCSANSKFKGERNSSVTDAEQITLDPKQATVGAGPAVRSAASTSFLVENLLKPTPPKPSPSIYPIDVSDSSDSEKEFGQMPNEETAYSSDESECNCEQSDEETKHLSKTDEIFRYLRIKKVDESKFRTVINSLVEMREFYLSQTNFKRRQPRMSPSTWSKTLERLITFLVFCQATLKLSPDLGLVENMHVVESFIMYLKNERRVKSSTAARYVFVLTVTAKFLHAEESRQNYEQVESISDLRALTTQLEKENSMLDAKVPQRNRLFWPQFQELTRSLHCQYEDASPRSKEQARIHMDFTLLLLFAINPGRAKEFRTLRVLSDVEDAELDQTVSDWPIGENVMVFTTNGSIRLVEKGYKTVKIYGPNVIELDGFEFVAYHLQRYREVSRPRLLPKGCTHDSFFVNKSGLQFQSPGSFSRYLAKIFEINLGFRCSMNDLRHALVEHFRSSKECSDVQLAESLARVCKHSLRTQINIYDRRTEQERRKRAFNYLQRSAVTAIVDEIPGPSSAISEDEQSHSEEEDGDRLPPVGEICALIPSDANGKSPEIFVARVLKYSEDRQTVRLAWLKEDQDRVNCYKFEVGHATWEEKVSSVIYPIDLWYNRHEGIYELRSSKEEIYERVR